MTSNSGVGLTPPRTRHPSPEGTCEGKKSSEPERIHANLTIANWKKLRSLRSDGRVVLDGSSLDLADVVVVASRSVPISVSLDPKIREKIQQSIDTLRTHLEAGHLVYGVTTGFGGSADARTSSLHQLQRALLQHQNAGILTSADIGLSTDSNSFDLDQQSMPTSWVRASMLTRCNSVLRGHSAVRLEVTNTILALLECEITPVVPLRGSISASGDLAPLSYVAGAIEGNPNIYVRIGKGNSRISNARQALREFNIKPVVLGPKEGLGLLNGTAFSVATAALALSKAHELAVLSQVLTAMCVEALQGTAESFDPMIAAVRPHPGQIEAAKNILSFLQGSSLAQGVRGPKDTQMEGLYQDRYATRTASQFIGPQLEDLVHAQKQLHIELNSTTDNPLTDVDNNKILHGGNFQAAVVTSTMDRARLAIDKLGRILFAQATEMIDPSMNKGLPANLSSDDPGTSFTCKGIDINMAAYASELGFLANPVGNHIMSAEMHNQSVNSLALISARYTLQAVDILSILSAAYLFCACQALDLRVLQLEFLNAVRPELGRAIKSTFVNHDVNQDGTHDPLESVIFKRLATVWPTTTTSDLKDRCDLSAKATVEDLAVYFQHAPSAPSLNAILTFTSELSRLLENTYDNKRREMYTNHVALTPTYLGRASQSMYRFVREELDISMHRGLIEHPTEPAPSWMSEEDARQRKTLGSHVSKIYEAIKDGRVMGVLVDVFEPVTSTGP